MRDPLKVAAGWFALAIVLVALVEIVPSSSRFLVWTLGLVALYLLLTNVEKSSGLIDSLVRNLAP